MLFTTLTASALVALAQANLMVTNWCQNDVTAWQSSSGGCNHGPNGICFDQPGAAPFTIPGGRNTLAFPLIADGQGTSIKISNGNNPGVLQYEYTVSDTLFWDISDIDGAGAASAGSPFFNQNVKVTPTGNGVGQGTCTQLKCPAGQICADAYNAPDETKTRACPADTGDQWLDLCEPDPWFGNKRARDFTPS